VDSKDFNLTGAALARMFGVTAKSIRDARTDGRLSEGVSWVPGAGPGLVRYNAAAAQIEWDANAQDGRQKIYLAEGVRTDGITKSSTFNDIKKAQARVDLERKTLELQKTKGILVEKARVYDALFEFAQKVRGRVRAVPARIVDDLLASPDRVDALRILSEALDEALNDLADADDKNLKI